MTQDLTRYAWLSVAAALLTLALKSAAYWKTGSVSLLSDALESLVNLAAALLALAMLRWAAQPPDEDHSFGHDKAEYISSGVEGALIFVAAVGIVITAVPRLLNPQPLQQISLGLSLSVVASLINGATAWVLLKAGRRHQSVALKADAHHLLTDCWSSAAVLIGVAGVAATGYYILDPIAALVVAAYIAWTATRILHQATHGILDASLPAPVLENIEALLDSYRSQGLDFHALRTRQAGRVSFIQLHVLVPGEWNVVRGHNFLEELEEKIRVLVPNARIHTHLEPIEDPSSFEDIALERPQR